jgi:hypothetical protein
LLDFLLDELDFEERLPWLFVLLFDDDDEDFEECVLLDFTLSALSSATPFPPFSVSFTLPATDAVFGVLFFGVTSVVGCLPPSFSFPYAVPALSP